MNRVQLFRHFKDTVATPIDTQTTTATQPIKIHPPEEEDEDDFEIIYHSNNKIQEKYKAEDKEPQGEVIQEQPEQEQIPDQPRLLPLRFIRVAQGQPGQLDHYNLGDRLA